MKRLILLFLILLLFAQYSVDACTSIIISGKYTKNGRPIIWKNRDTDEFQNVIMYFTDGKYDYMGLIDANDIKGESVWIGYNSAGFAIMNTASYNLIDKDTVDIEDREGILMRMAFKECSSVEDFEKFLINLPKPLGVEANFGIIDAKGGAAYFEVDNYQFKKLDVNDPKIAPFGYLIHTNFSFTGNMDKGSGQIRYKTAEDLFYQAAQQNNLTPRFILQHVSRSLWHSLTKVDLKTQCTSIIDEQRFFFFEDFIPRYFTSASVVIEGVNPGENPDFTTMWTILGFPLSSVVFPLWLCEGKHLPSLVVRNDDGVAPLCDKALKLKEILFPIKKTYGEKYINVNALYNTDNVGIMQKLKPLDDKIFDVTLQNIKEWQKNKNFHKEILLYYQWLNETINAEFLKLFGI